VNRKPLVDDYERDGVVRVRQFFSPEETAAVRERIARYIDDRLGSLPEQDYVLEPDGASVRNLWRMEKHDPFFDELAHRPEIVGLVGPLVHGDPVLMGVESFNKPAHVGSPVPPHQDNAYFCWAPPDALTVWIALDAATHENGPIYYIRGSHRGGLLPHGASGVSGNSMGLKAPPKCDDPFIGLLEAGDALIHHAETIHYSAANASDQPRLGLLLVYRGAHCVKNPDLVNAYPAAAAT